MNAIFSAAMRKAAELTARQNFVEATQVIQRALRGRAGAAPQDPVREAGPYIELKAEASSTFEAPEEQASAASSSPARTTRPLGEVVRTLRQSELGKFARGVALDLTAPMAKPRKAPTVVVPDGASYLTRSYACEAGTRDYRLYLPSKAGGGRRPLIVMLHGCTQDADDFAVGTGMNRLAEEHGFVVAYPKQVAKANQMTCWNWFDPKDQTRDRGEPRVIAGITREIITEFNIDPERVFVAGLSAGGAMAEIMAAAYPELYAATGVHSGLAYAAANDMPSAFAAMSGGPRHEMQGRKAGVRTIVFHGTSDRTVHPSNGQAIVDGARASLGGSVRTIQSDGAAGGRGFRRTVVADAQGVAHVEHWAIEGLGHAWSGGDPEGSYTDRQGPDASREMLRFFLGSAAGPATS